MPKSFCGGLADVMLKNQECNICSLTTFLKVTGSVVVLTTERREWRSGQMCNPTLNTSESPMIGSGRSKTTLNIGKKLTLIPDTVPKFDLHPDAIRKKSCNLRVHPEANLKLIWTKVRVISKVQSSRFTADAAQASALDSGTNFWLNRGKPNRC